MHRRTVVPALVAATLVLFAAGTNFAPIVSRHALGQPTIVALGPFELWFENRNELVGVVTTGDDTIYVSDRGDGIVYRLPASGGSSVAVSGLARPAGLALDAGGRLLIAEEHAGRVLRLEPSGILTVLATGIRTPRWIAANPDGSLYVSAHGLQLPDGPDTSEGRVILHLAPDGALTTVAGGIQRVEGLARLDGGLVAAAKGLDGASGSTGTLLSYPVLAGGTLGPPTALAATGLKQPVGLTLDMLGALYVSTKELKLEQDTAKRAIAKIYPDLQLSDFAAGLTDPQGLALGSDGSLYLADGKAGRLVRFRAPPAPTVHMPVVTNQTSVTLGGTTEPDARLDVLLDETSTPLTAVADGNGGFSIMVPLATNAVNDLDVFATSHQGRGLTSAPAPASVLQDTVAPALALASLPATVRQTVTVQADASDAGEVASLAVSLDGQGLGAGVTPTPPATAVRAATLWDTTAIADGAHELTALAIDRAGNAASAARAVIVDNTPPDTEIIGGPGGDTVETTLTFTFTGTDNLTSAAGLEFAWRLDAGLWSAFGPATGATLNAVDPGPHVFAVRARDLAGNEDPTPALRSFVVSALSVAIIEPAAGATVAAGPVLVRGTVQNGGQEIGISVNGSAAVLGSGEWVAEIQMPAGSQPITAVASSFIGGHATATITVTVTPATPAVFLHSSPESGVTPLVVGWQVVNQTGRSLVALRLDETGTGIFGPAVSSLDGMRTTYTAPGFTFPALRATDDQGVTYLARTVVHVEDAQALTTRFQRLWAGLKDRLRAGDHAGALAHVAEESRARFEAVFQRLGPDLPAIAAGLGDLEVVGRVGDLAETVLVQQEDGTAKLHFIYFRRDGHGQWLIEEM